MRLSGRLYVSGGFGKVGDGRAAPQVSASFVARWDGSSWSDVGGSSPNDEVVSVLATPDALWIGGNFRLIGQRRSNLTESDATSSARPEGSSTLHILAMWNERGGAWRRRPEPQ